MICGVGAHPFSGRMEQRLELVWHLRFKVIALSFGCFLRPGRAHSAAFFLVSGSLSPSRNFLSRCWSQAVSVVPGHHCVRSVEPLTLLQAITIKRRRDRTPKVQSRNSDFAILRAAIGRSRKSQKPLCYPSSQLWCFCKIDCLVKVHALCAVRIFWPYGIAATRPKLADGVAPAIWKNAPPWRLCSFSWCRNQ
jgi:hypothetical protein